jgi:hypothetical protein
MGWGDNYEVYYIPIFPSCHTIYGVTGIYIITIYNNLPLSNPKRSLYKYIIIIINNIYNVYIYYISFSRDFPRPSRGKSRGSINIILIIYIYNKIVYKNIIIR